MTQTTFTPPVGKYAVIGASGMIGTHILARLADRPGLSVTAVCHNRSAQVTAANIDSVAADAADADDLAERIDGADYVLVAAGILATAPVLAADPVGPVLRNLRIVTGALEAAYRVRCRKCVWLSSTTGFPPVEEDLAEDDMFRQDPPDSWYGIGWATRYLETQCRWYAEKLDPPMPTVVLRPSMVYGEYDHFDEASSHFLPSLIRRVVNRERPIEVWGTGEQTRDLIYAGDVAQAMFAALNSDRPFATYNVGGGRAFSINECLSMLLHLDGYTDAVIEHRHDKPTSVSKRRIAIDRIRDDLGFAPAVDLEEGLRRTLDWYKKTCTQHA